MSTFSFSLPLEVCAFCHFRGLLKMRFFENFNFLNNFIFYIKAKSIKLKRMKTKQLMLLGISLGLTLSFSLFTNNAVKSNASVGNYTTDVTSYYADMSNTTGTALLGELHDLMNETHKTYTVYADVGKNGYQRELDADPENSGKIIEFYSQVSWPGSWDPNSGSTTGGYNREHVWCQSLSNGLWGEDGGGADMHHLRPVENRLNSTRSNNLYGELTNRDSYKVYAKLGTSSSYLGGYNNGGVFEPLDNVKGDVARILFYMYMHYNKASNVGGSSSDSSYFGTLPITNIVSASTNDAAFSMLLEWNELDPVSEYEKTRNEVASKYQGNRNPFIDYSDLAECIWNSKSFNWSTRTIEGESSDTTSTLSLDKTFVTLTVGDSSTVTATSSSSVTWSINDSSVASLSTTSGYKVTLTALKAGTTTLTASNGSLTKTCSISVNEKASTDTLSLDKTSISLKVDETSTVTATSNNTVTWSIDDSSVASLSASSGNSTTVTALKAGSATLTATSGS